jgi:hypothetical protein
MESVDDSTRSFFLSSQMGNNFSSRQDFYVHSMDNTHTQELQDQVMIRLIPDGTLFVPVLANPFRRLVSEKDDSQKICILGLSLVYICNESKYDVNIQLQNIFDVAIKKNEDTAHTDDTGCLKILCPANFNGPVLGNDRILYKPRLTLDVIRNYAGLNILDINIKPMQEGGQNEMTLLELAHPIVYFILNNEDKLQEFGNSVNQIQRTNDPNFVKIETVYLNRVKEFFKNTIYDDLRMTRFDDVKIASVIPKGLFDELQNRKISPPLMSVTVIIQINYLQISSGSGKIKHQQIKI